MLLTEPVALAVVSNMLCDYPLLKVGSPQRKDWVGGGDFVLIQMDKKQGGTLLVDVVDVPWPDVAGDSQAQPDLVAAWGMGYFGPFAAPGALERAVQFCLRCPGLREQVPSHRGFIRLRTSYVLGAGKDAPYLPAKYSYEKEFMMMGEVVDRLLTLPSALCYFNPNGETLYTRGAARERAEMFMRKKLPPLELWCNVRRYDPGVEGWTMMDIVGMEQMDLSDSEVYATPRYSPTDLAAFLVNTSVMMATKKLELQDGSVVKGPGGMWRMRIGSSVAPPGRRVFKWFPDVVDVPGDFLGGAE